MNMNEGDIPTDLYLLSCLEVLNLSFNQIRSAGSEHIFRMKGIANLNIQSNQIIGHSKAGKI